MTIFAHIAEQGIVSRWSCSGIIVKRKPFYSHPITEKSPVITICFLFFIISCNCYIMDRSSVCIFRPAHRPEYTEINHRPRFHISIGIKFVFSYPVFRTIRLIDKCNKIINVGNHIIGFSIYFPCLHFIRIVGNIGKLIRSVRISCINPIRTT